MKRIDPGSLSDRPVLLTPVYPFMRRRAQDHRGQSARVQAKLLVLLGHTLTFAGSTLLLDEVAYRFFDDCRALFEAGTIIPDLRSEAESFRHLAELRKGSRIPAELVNRAEWLDALIPGTLVFEPSSVSSLYSADLVAFIDEELRRQGDAAELDRLLRLRGELLAAPPLSREFVAKASAGLQCRRRLTRVGDYLYCATGAEVVRADLVVPGTFVREHAMLINQQEDRTPLPHEEMLAAQTLFAYGAFDSRAIDMLSAAEVLALRNDVRMQDAAIALHKIAAAASKPGILSDLRDVSLAVETLVHEACRSEQRRRAQMDLASDVVWDQVPFVGSVLRRGVVALRKSTARMRHLSAPAKTFTPLTTFVSVLREHVEGRTTLFPG